MPAQTQMQSNVTAFVAATILRVYFFKITYKNVDLIKTFHKNYHHMLQTEVIRLRLEIRKAMAIVHIFLSNMLKILTYILVSKV